VMFLVLTTFADELWRICLTEPTLSRLQKSSDSSWIEDLRHLGVL